MKKACAIAKILHQREMQKCQRNIGMKKVLKTDEGEAGRVKTADSKNWRGLRSPQEYAGVAGISGIRPSKSEPKKMRLLDRFTE